MKIEGKYEVEIASPDRVVVKHDGTVEVYGGEGAILKGGTLHVEGGKIIGEEAVKKNSAKEVKVDFNDPIDLYDIKLNAFAIYADKNSNFISIATERYIGSQFVLKIAAPRDAGIVGILVFEYEEKDRIPHAPEHGAYVYRLIDILPPRTRHTGLAFGVNLFARKLPED